MPSNVEQFELEKRHCARANHLRGWKRTLVPSSVRLSVDVLPLVNRTFDIEVVEQEDESESGLVVRWCGHGNFVPIPAHQRHRRNIGGTTFYVHGLRDHTFDLKTSERLGEQVVPTRPEGVAISPHHILSDLEAIRNEQDEPDFRHSSTDHAHALARSIIEGAYTHYLGNAPEPAAAPDGDGGVIVEWQSGRRVVRLVVPASKDERSYLYSRGDGPSKIDDPATDLILAQRLRSIFAD